MFRVSRCELQEIMQYELFYLVGEKNEANLETIREEVAKILTDEKATLVDPELVEKRKLAYEIKHQNKGTYVTRRFDLPELDFWADEKNAEKEFGISAITRKLNLYKNVLRFMIVKADELPELGAKEKRKQQELKGEKFQPKKEEKTTKPVKPIKAKPQPTKKEEKVEEKVEAPKEKKKEEKKDIDKQLDELLNI